MTDLRKKNQKLTDLRKKNKIEIDRLKKKIRKKLTGTLKNKEIDQHMKKERNWSAYEKRKKLISIWKKKEIDRWMTKINRDEKRRIKIDWLKKNGRNEGKYTRNW